MKEMSCQVSKYKKQNI